MANIAGYKFSNKHHSGKGICSTGFGTASLVLLIVLILIASKSHGEGSIYLGSVGLVSMVFSLIGLVIGIISFFEPEKYKLFSKIGAVFNLVVLLIWVSIFMIGA